MTNKRINDLINFFDENNETFSKFKVFFKYNIKPFNAIIHFTSGEVNMENIKIYINLAQTILPSLDLKLVKQPIINFINDILNNSIQTDNEVITNLKTLFQAELLELDSKPSCVINDLKRKHVTTMFKTDAVIELYNETVKPDIKHLKRFSLLQLFSLFKDSDYNSKLTKEINLITLTVKQLYCNKNANDDNPDVYKIWDMFIEPMLISYLIFIYNDKVLNETFKDVLDEIKLEVKQNTLFNNTSSFYETMLF